MVVRKEGFDSFFSQISWSIATLSRTNRRITQLEATHGFRTSIVLVAALEVAHEYISTRSVIREVAKCFCRLCFVAAIIHKPARVGSPLCVVSNQWLHQVGNSRVGSLNISSRHQYLFATLAEAVPLFCIFNRFIGNFKVSRKVLNLHATECWFETLAGRSLLIAIASNVRAFQTYPKRSFSEPVVGYLNIFRRQVGASGGRG
mmetsp:Transcript_4290/g.7155  ORF Transcript_4290/g.7155 Transcript_4290/m.7155 type:complete len:203 (+) Transcript_4290:553-1161(+)